VKIVRTLILAAPLVLLSAGSGQAQSFNPADFRTLGAEPAGEVLVLASPNLSRVGPDFDAATLEPLLERLARFNPAGIAVEQLSGESLHRLQAYEVLYPESAESFGGRQLQLADMAKATTGLSLVRAEGQARRLLKDLDQTVAPSQRRRLTAIFAASGDLGSALVQWRRWGPDERRPGDGVSADLAAALDDVWIRHNEVWRVGVELAVRLKLERLHSIDDHDADDLMTPEVVRDLTTAISQNPGFQAVMSDPFMVALQGEGDRLSSASAALELYRDMNSEGFGRRDAELQWLTMLREPIPGDAGRIRVAEWEARNLRQVAHIREAAAAYPGERLLVIVGASHKAWFDAYLGMMTDLVPADAALVLANDGQGAGSDRSGADRLEVE